jgi:hypothetical protein
MGRHDSPPALGAGLLTPPLTRPRPSTTSFEETQRWTFAYLGGPSVEGRNERLWGVDLGRENIDPLVNAVEEIAEAMKSNKPLSFSMPRMPFQ